MLPPMLRLLLTLALAGEPDLLAPTVDEIHAVSAELQRRLKLAAELGAETATLQNAWVQRGAPGRKPCADAEDTALAFQAQDAGERWRDAAQAARAEASRLSEMLKTATATSLLSEEIREREQERALSAQVEARRALEASAWQQKYLGATLGRCPRPDPGTPKDQPSG